MWTRLCGQNVDKSKNKTEKTPEPRFGSLKIQAKMPDFRAFFLLACFFDSNSNRNGHTNHGVVACADQTHHFYMKSAFGGFPRVKKRA